MAPFIIAALVAAGLFGTGTVVKPQQPVIGTVLQGAGVGALVGGGLGSIAGVGATLGTTSLASSVAVGSTIGGVAGAGAGYELSQHPVTVYGYTLSAKHPMVHARHITKHVNKKVASVPLPPHRPANL